MTAAAKEGMEAGNRAKWQRWVPWIALAIFVLDALGYGWFRHSQCYSSLRKGLINRATRYFFSRKAAVTYRISRRMMRKPAMVPTKNQNPPNLEATPPIARDNIIEMKSDVGSIGSISWTVLY